MAGAKRAVQAPDAGAAARWHGRIRPPAGGTPPGSSGILRRALLASTLLSGIVMVPPFSLLPLLVGGDVAHAGGGAGSAGQPRGGTGGIDAVGAGGAGGSPVDYGGGLGGAGGGGAGTTGGSGGTGGLLSPGGAGGASPGASGANGSAGGAGGGGGAHGFVGAVLPTVNVQGGNGGNGAKGFDGANGGLNTDGGGGGAGGYGAMLTTSSASLGTLSVNVTGGNGGNGGDSGVTTDPTFFYYGGNGGSGGGGLLAGLENTLTISSHVTGGNGGAGGAALSSSDAGASGGKGGYGVSATDGTSLTITAGGTVAGGNGGQGGAGTVYGRGLGGNGGDGGAGIFAPVTTDPAFPVTIINNGSITGGNGGKGGAGPNGNPATAGATGAGGAGIFGANLDITTSGSISGGLGGDGVTRADAITVTSGPNYLTLANGWSLTGNLGINGAGTGLVVQVDGIDATIANTITGTGQLGVSVQGHALTLSGTNTYSGGTVLALGTLIVSSDANLGAASGGLTIGNAVLENTAAFTSGRNVSVIARAGFQTDADLTLIGEVSGQGNIVKLGTGVLTLSNSGNSYKGFTTIEAGTLSVDSGGALGATRGILFDSPATGVTGLPDAASALTSAIAAYASAPTQQNADALASAQATYDAAVAAGQGAGTLATLKATGAVVLDGGTVGSVIVMQDDAGAVLLEGDGASLTMKNYTTGNPAIAVQQGGVLDLRSGSGATQGFTFSGNRGAGVILNNGGTVHIADATFSNNSGGGAILNNGGTVHIADSTFSGNSGTQSGAIFSSGTMAIGQSTFSGNTAQLGGAITSMTGSTLVISESTFTGNRADLLGGAISLTGATAVIEDSSFTGNSAGILGGAIAMNGGALTLATSANATSLFSGNLSGGYASTPIVASSIALNGSPASLSVVTDAGGLTDMRDPMSGTSQSTITQTGAGTWALGGRNAFTAAGVTNSFTVSEGRLYLYGAGEVANPNADDANARVAAGSVKLAGAGSAFTVGGTATLVAGGANAITTDGTIVFKDGATVRGGNADTALGGADASRREAGGATSLTLTAAGGITLEGNLNAAALGAGDTFTLSSDLGGANGSLTKLGAGTVVLTGANTYAKGTTIAAGTLALSGAGTLAPSGAVALTGNTAVFDLSGANGDRTIGDLSGVGGSTVKLGSNGLAAGTGNDTTFAGTFDGSGTLTKQGTGALLLTGDSSGFAGATTVAAGTLLVGDHTGGALGGTVTVDAGATLGGSGTIGGATTVNGTLSAGNSPGTLTFKDDLTLASGSTSVFELNTPGVTGGSGNDLVRVDGTLTLGGTLEANVGAAGYYTLFSYGSLATGSSFATTNVTGTGGFQVEKSVLGYGGGTDSAVTLLAAGAGQTVQFWDGANLTGNGTVDGGTGTWNATNSNWTGAPGNADINAPWIGSVGVFMGTAGTVTVEGTQAVDTLQFKTDGYVLTGGTLALAPASGSFGTISTDAGVTATIGSVIADGNGAAGLAKTGGGTLVLTGVNTYSGGTEIKAGVVSVAADANLGDAAGGLTLDGGTLRNTAAFTSGRAVTLGSGNGGVDTQADLGLSGVVGGNGGLIKSGAGVLTLSGANTYQGGTEIKAGVVSVSSDDNLGDAAGGLILDGGTLRNTAAFTSARAVTLGSGNGGLDTEADLTLSGVVGGSGGLIKSGAGVLTLSGANTYQGGTEIKAGVVSVSSDDNLGDAAGGLTLDGGTLRNTAAFTSARGVTLGSGNQTLDTEANLALSGVVGGPGGLIKSGAGVLTLSGANTYQGGTDIKGGVVSVASDANLGDAAGGLTLDGGTLRNTSAFTSARAVTLGSGNQTLDTEANLALSGVVGGPGGLTKTGAGILTLSGANTYQGGTDIKGGVASVSSDANLGDAAGGLTLDGGTLRNTAAFTSARSVTIGSGNGAFDTEADLALSGVVSGAGRLYKVGVGVLTLSGANTYQGGTDIKAGVVSVSSDDNLGDAAGGLTLNGGTLRNTAAFTSTRAVTLGSGNGAFDTEADLALSGVVSGAGRLYKVGAGVLTLSGANTYQGGTSILGGTLSVAADANLGDAAGGLILDSGTLKTTAAFTSARAVTLGSGNGGVDTEADLTLSGVVGGTGGLIKSGAGVLTLSGANTYQGGTAITAGTVSVSSDANLGDAAGGILLAGGTLGTTASFTSARDVGVSGAGGFDVAGGTQFTLAGGISGTGTLTKSGDGTLALAGPSGLDWNVDAGRLAADVSRFAGDVALSGGATFALTATALGGYDGTLSGTGTFEKTGAGTLFYLGSSGGFAGTTDVAAGRLVVDGTLGGTVNVLSGAILNGTGTIGALHAGAGSVVDPGHSIGTLTVTGNASFATGSTYAVELGAAGQSDLLAVGGTATIASGTTLVVDAQQPYTLGERFTLITSNGLSGSFGTVTGDVGQVSAFYGTEVVYDYAGGNVFLDVAQTRAFAAAAVTPNQASTARALNSLSLGNPLYDAIAWLPTDAAARGAFDQLSGQIGASAQGLFVEQGGIIRNAAIDRLRASQGGVGASVAPVMAYAAASGAGATEAGQALQAIAAPATTAGPALWATGFGNWTTMDATFNAAGLTASTGGVLMGLDTALEGGWRIGAMGGYSATSFSLGGLASSGSSDNWHMGLYGGGQWGALALRTGLAYTGQDVSTTRTVVFPGFTDQLKANYTAGLFQAFAEAGYRIDGPIAAFEPFADIAYASLSTGDYRETGGSATLISGGNGMATEFTTLGMRVERQLLVGGVGTTLRGTVGWRHAFGDITPDATQAFVGSAPFTITGLPIARDALVLDAGLDVALSRSATLGLAYVGQMGNGTSQNGLNAALKLAF